MRDIFVAAENLAIACTRFAGCSVAHSRHPGARRFSGISSAGFSL
ncbi:hypothetical protein [Methanoculleus frigidifontis]|nr:hypothetical protein [Methanoculleus sp. FWC-SCC1]